MPSINFAYVNGSFIPEAQATVSIFDRGFLYGDGCFETMRVYNGKIFRLAEHLRRLKDGLAELAIDMPADCADTVRELIKRNQVADGTARVYVTRGTGRLGLSTRELSTPSVVAVVQPRVFPAEPAPWRALLSAWRLPEHSQLGQAKTANRLLYVMAKHEAEREGVDDAILFNERGFAVELSAANLFAVVNDELWTPSIYEGALPGITRAVVIELAGKLGLKVAECGFEREFLLTGAEELFATNSLVEIVPIRELNRLPKPVGAVTLKLREAYREFVQEDLGL